MKEIYFREQLIEFLYEQGFMFFGLEKHVSTSLLCLIAACGDYSFSDEMINDFPKFIPSEDEIKKYK